MSGSNEAIELLRSIDASLKALLAQTRQAQPKPVAPDRDLDGKYGDPTIKFTPRDWTGAPFKGRRMSECPPEFLDLIAETFDYFAEQAEKNNEQTDGGKLIAPYKRQDAARARGWAKRARNGTHAPASPQAGASDDEWGRSEGF